MSNAEKMVMVPRELVEIAMQSCFEAGFGIPHDALREILAQPAQQHQGEPVTLPERMDPTSADWSEDRRASGWNACLDEIAKLGPLYTHADPAEVGRLRQFELAYMEWIKKTEWVQQTASPKELGMHRADIINQRLDTMRAQLTELQQAFTESQEEVVKRGKTLAEAHALLRGKSGDLIRMAAHLISAPLFALQDLRDEDKKMTRARVDHAVDVADARLKDAAYELRQIANTLSARAEPEVKS